MSGDRVRRLPKLIRITKSRSAFSFTVDGEEFPFYVADGQVCTSIGNFPAVTVTILAERLEIVHDEKETGRAEDDDA